MGVVIVSKKLEYYRVYLNKIHVTLVHGTVSYKHFHVLNNLLAVLNELSPASAGCNALYVLTS